jgi:hypothetical protein
MYVYAKVPVPCREPDPRLARDGIGAVQCCTNLADRSGTCHFPPHFPDMAGMAALLPGDDVLGPVRSRFPTLQ